MVDHIHNPATLYLIPAIFLLICYALTDLFP